MDVLIFAMLIAQAVSLLIMSPRHEQRKALRALRDDSETEASTLGLHQLVGMSVESIGVCQTLECQHAGNHDVAPRASEENCAILLGPPFENRYDEDKALERIECENCGKGVVSG